ncbi:MAG: hypothetical protein R3F07_09705 [Opitutaceae bacterium]
MFLSVTSLRFLTCTALLAAGPVYASSQIDLSQPPEPTALTLNSRERQLALHERQARVIDDFLELTDAGDLDKGSLHQIAACLAAGQKVEWARQRLKRLNESPSGAMFWMYPMVLTMKAGAANLNEEDWAGIRQAWKTYFPYRGDTENHWLMYYSSLFLAAETWPDLPGEEWYNGKSSAENRDEAKEYILNWMDITTSYGQGEYDSPNYIDTYVAPMGLLAAYARDADLRQRAAMMLDYVILDYAVEDLDGLYGGAHSRVYPKHVMQPSLAPASQIGWLLFNQGEYQRGGGILLMALIGYEPPGILYRIAHDRSVPYEHRELKRTRWRMRHAGPDAFTVGLNKTVPVYKYSYVTSDYLLGSSQGGLLQPIQQQTWSLLWSEKEHLGVSNTFFALHPYHSPLEGTMYFGADWDTVTDLIARSKVDYNSPDKLKGGSPYEQVFQHKSALIALYDIPIGTDFPFITTFFSRDLTEVDEDESGWIFARGGPCFIAYRPFASGEWKPAAWTGLLAGGAGAWISSGFDEWGEGHQCLVSESPKNGYIVQVASASSFDSFESFKDAVRDLPVSFSIEGSLAADFISLDGDRIEARYGMAPVLNGIPVDFSSWKLFDGPFAQSERESRKILIRHGPETLKLDFVTGAVESTVSPATR